MTTTTIAGVVDKPVDAQRLVDELVSDCLCDRADISVMARDSVQARSRQGADTVKQALDTNAAAAKTLIDWASHGLESVTRSVPGGGIIRAMGSLGARLASAGVSTAADLAKALVDLGVPRGEAQSYGQAFESGGIVVTVQARTENIARCARTVMMKYGAVADEPAAAAR
jgi:hypothetical protein